MGIPTGLFFFLLAMLKAKASVVAENAAMRQQIAVFNADDKRPKLRPREITNKCLAAEAGGAEERL